MEPREAIIVADDHPLFRSALERAVRQTFPNAGIAAVETFDELRAVVGETAADLLLLDLNMPGCRGYSALAYVRHQQPELPVVIVSAFETPQVIRGALDHGASGFIPKSASMATIMTALQAVYNGELWVPEELLEADEERDRGFAERLNMLTPRQLQVLMMVIEGMLNKQIAIDMSITEATVKAHITAILRKLQVYTRTQAVIAARSLDIDWGALAAQQMAGSEH